MNVIRLPALIDPHVHFRTPGFPEKEDWVSGGKAALAGGVTTVFDMPNTKPATVTYERLMEKKALINAQLTAAKLPLHYGLFFGADKNHFDELYKVKDHIVGIKVFMGSSTGDLLMDDEASLEQLFKIAAELDLLVAVHAEDETMIQANMKRYQSEIHADNYALHAQIRSPEVAAKALKTAVDLVRAYGTRLYALHIGSRLELELLHQAKEDGLPVYIETAPHYLFLDTDDYPRLKGRAQMNPPLRSPADRQFLWDALRAGWIDTIGSDHAPHPLADKLKPYPQCSSGVPGVETTLPLLLNAHNEGLISIEQIIALTSTHAKRIFNLPDHDEWITVDLDQTHCVTADRLHSKAGWSPYEGWILKGAG